jgi:hypothetical protein
VQKEVTIIRVCSLKVIRSFLRILLRESSTVSLVANTMCLHCAKHFTFLPCLLLQQSYEVCFVIILRL